MSHTINNQMTHYFDEVDTFFLDKELEDILHCPICDEEIYTYYNNNKDLAQCHCGMVWRCRQPKQKVLDQFYEKSKAMETWSKIKNGAKEKRRQDNKFGPIRLFSKVNHIKSILDFGCGNGSYLDKMSATIHRVGIEVNQDARKYCNFTTYESIQEMEASEKQRFDCVTAFGVLEHHKDPIYMLQSLTSLLTDEGFLMIIVPNINSLVVKYLKDKCATFCPQHLWYFNQQTLDALVKKATGFFHYDGWTCEHEAQVVARYVSGLNPYEDLGGYNLKDPRFDPEMILNFDLGYKLISIYKKG